ncbi:MAG: hypothetical protein ABI818_15040, partial [Acidobacteriota bacterium]
MNTDCTRHLGLALALCAIGFPGTAESRGATASEFETSPLALAPPVVDGTRSPGWTRVTTTQRDDALSVLISGDAARSRAAMSAAACEISLLAADQTVGMIGGFVSFGIVSSAPDCAWSLSNIEPWIHLESPVAGFGSATIILDVSRNDGPGRASAIGGGGQTFLVRQFGPGEFRRTAGDLTGDGIADLSVYRASTGGWLVPGLRERTLGGHHQIPVPADYDGDAAADVATYETATGLWRIGDGAAIAWGLPGDIPVAADYDGDGRAELAVFRPALGRWFIRNVGTFDWGRPDDIPVPADFDGDGRADIAVFR